MQKRPGGQMIGASSTLTQSQLYPFLINSRDLLNKAYFLPVMVTVLLVALLFANIGDPLLFMKLLGTYLIAAGVCFVYLLCGKKTPWWFLLTVALTTAWLLKAGFFDTVFMIIPSPTAARDSFGNPKGLIDSAGANLKYWMFVGFREELFKAVPLAAAFILGRSLMSPWRERLGLWEPLDGILLAAASAAGFTFIETLIGVPGQFTSYVDKIMGRTVAVYCQALKLPCQTLDQIPAGPVHQIFLYAASYRGLALLIPRTLGDVAGHIAYSGYLGYFVGLAVLKPKMAWQLLGVGYLFAAGLHAAWDGLGEDRFVTGQLGDAVPLLLLGGAAYVGLAAAILKARQISPTRATNFATQVVSAPRTAPSSVLALHIGNQAVPLHQGAVLTERDIAGLKAQSLNGIVAEVTRNPRDPSVLGLTNLSSVAWMATTPVGDIRDVQANQSLRLEAGTRIDFGRARGEVR